MGDPACPEIKIQLEASEQHTPQLVRSAARGLGGGGMDGLGAGPVESTPCPQDGDRLLGRGLRWPGVPRDGSGPRCTAPPPQAWRGWACPAWAQPLTSARPCLPCTLSWHLYCRCSDHRAVSHSAALKVTPSRSVPALSSCLVGGQWGRKHRGRQGWADLFLSPSPLRGESYIFRFESSAAQLLGDPGLQFPYLYGGSINSASPLPVSC